MGQPLPQPLAASWPFPFPFPWAQGALQGKEGEQAGEIERGQKEEPLPARRPFSFPRVAVDEPWAGFGWIFGLRDAAGEAQSQLKPWSVPLPLSHPAARRRTFPDATSTAWPAEGRGRPRAWASAR